MTKVFLWKGKDQQGVAKSGEIEAENKSVAMVMLRRQQIQVTQLKAKPIEIHLFKEKVDDKDIAVFLRQLATMISAGIPLVQCFELAESGSENKAMSKLLKGIREGLEKGSPLAETMRKFPEEFDRLSCALIEAGEQGGILDGILIRLCGYKEKTLKLKAKIKSALFYPVAILVVSFIVTSILMIFVIPIFSEMFADFGAELPWMTQMAMSLSDLFVKFWYVILFAPMLLVVFLRSMYQKPKGRYQLDKLLLRLPILGMILRKASVARFCRTFSTLSAAGVPILESLDTVAETAGNAVVEAVIIQAKISITQGQTLTEPLAESGIFPSMVTQMIAIGEQSGSLEEMLGKIADFYEEDVDTAVENMSQLMEPFIMAFLGVVIGGLVIAMYLPIFQMASVV